MRLLTGLVIIGLLLWALFGIRYGRYSKGGF
jgi:hypothetical protein